MKDFSSLWAQAMAAGNAAAASCNVRPMVVAEANVLTGEANGKRWFVADGACGFAWIKFKGNSSFVRWGKKQGLLGATGYWCGLYNQSMQKKEAHCNAMAAVLQANGVECYADSRMD